MADPKETPTLQTARLTLRSFQREDAFTLHCILNEEGILRYFPNPNPPSMERVLRIIEGQLTHWAEHGFGWWAVVLHGQEELMGWNGLQFLPETNETEVGYLLSRRFWGRGYTTEGARAALQFGFERFELEQIIGLVHPENIASQRVLEKAGLKFTNQAKYFGMELYRYMVYRSAYLAI